MISIVACCHGAKLCPHVAWDFRSQHNQGFHATALFSTHFYSTDTRKPKYDFKNFLKTCCCNEMEHLLVKQ